MPCNHLGPTEIMAMAEQDLNAQGLPAEQWPGLRFRHGVNTPDGMWASVVTEIERRGDHWIVTRLDRSREALAEPETGLHRIP